MWSIGKAFKFPFQGGNGNLNKVLQIGIVFGVISAIEVVLNGGAQTGIGTFFGAIGGLLFALFVSGYGISVLQNIFRGDESLPQFDIGTSIPRGFAVFLASLMYFIPLIIIMACTFAFVFSSSSAAIDSVFQEITNQLADPNYVPNLSDSETAALGSLPLLLCGSLLFLVPLSIILSYALQIGMIRFAVEDRSGAMYEMGTNIKMVMNNLGAVWALFIRQFGIGLLYVFVGLALGLVSGILIAIMGFMGTMGLIVVGSFLNIFLGVFNTAQQISNIHLVSQFAYQLGLVESSEKPKNDDMQDVYSF